MKTMVGIHVIYRVIREIEKLRTSSKDDCSSHTNAYVRYMSPPSSTLQYASRTLSVSSLTASCRRAVDALLNLLHLYSHTALIYLKSALLELS